MNIIFIHNYFPGQFGLLAEISGKNQNNKTVFITSAANKDRKKIPGVEKKVYQHPPSGGSKDILQAKIQSGAAVANILADLKKKGVVPDLIIGHSGPGTALYVKEVFPHTPFLCFFDRFYSPDTLPGKFSADTVSDPSLNMEMKNRNLFILADLCACDHGICPTNWQKNQFPESFHKKLDVVYHSIDTQAFQPEKKQTFKTDFLDLSGAEYLITYCTNTLAPYMGFWQFMESLPLVMKKKPGAHIAIAGMDRIIIENHSGDKKSFKSIICEKINLNSKHVHFMESLDYAHYKKLLQASSVHVYLDSSHMVSPSLLHAMSCECLVMAPDIPSVREIITDGTNGIIADFSSSDNISRKILACLDYPSFVQATKKKARQTIIEKFAIDKTLPRQMKIIKSLVNKKTPKQFG